MNVHILYFDFETYANIDLPSCGADVYINHPTAKILCLSAIYGKEKLDWAPGEKFPIKWKNRFESQRIIKVAHNASFDLGVWNKLMPKGFNALSYDTVRCSQAACLAKGYPAKLSMIPDKLQIEEKKFAIGRAAMLEVTRLGEKNVRDLATKLKNIRIYGMSDVILMKKIYERVGGLSKKEIEYYNLTQEINSRGLGLDVESTNVLTKTLQDLYLSVDIKILKLLPEHFNPNLVKQGEFVGDGLTFLNSSQKFKKYLNDNGCDVPDVQEGTLKYVETDDKVVKKLLDYRILFCQSAIKKIHKMSWTVGILNRIRGALRYHGAHTGRWSGQGIQPQNFSRDGFHSDPILNDTLFSVYVSECSKFNKNSKVSVKDYKLLNDMAKTVRPLIQAKPKHDLLVYDYAQIEARVLAWLAGQSDLVNGFIKGKDIYLDFAENVIYNRPLTKKDNPTERSVGKTSILGAGFGMGWEKFIDTVYAQTGISITDDLSKKSIYGYREKYQKIKFLWGNIEACFKACLERKIPITFPLPYAKVQLVFEPDDNIKGMTIKLPSGRKLSYPNLAVTQGKYGKALTSDGAKMSYLYGGKLVENIIQAIARDIMGEAMLYTNNNLGLPIVLTVHDEIIWEVPKHRLTKRCIHNIEDALKNECVPKWFPKELIEIEGGVRNRYGK
jgi:DNA polymerase